MITPYPPVVLRGLHCGTLPVSFVVCLRFTSYKIILLPSPPSMRNVQGYITFCLFPIPLQSLISSDFSVSGLESNLGYDLSPLDSFRNK